jgi:hypothetical protein
LFVQLFKLDRLADFSELGLDEVVLGVAAGVELQTAVLESIRIVIQAVSASAARGESLSCIP